MPKVGESVTKAEGGGSREGWLTEVARQIVPIFKGFTLPPYKLTCGWPSRFALGLKVRALGECHGPQSSSGNYHEIFISPLLDKPLEVAGTITHEMTHVAAGIKAQHKGLFVRIRKMIGLTKHGPKQAMPGVQLEERLSKILDKMGEYPHKAIIPQLVTKPKSKADISLVCPGCGCLVRMTNKWFVSVGAPTCGCGAVMEEK